MESSKLAKAVVGLVPYLPPEIIVHVLVRLPVRILCKLCCVSKQWYALITDPIFCASYRRSRSEQNRRILLEYYPVDRVVFSSLDYKYRKLDPVEGFKMMKKTLRVAICLDLFCLYDKRNMYIWNPATGEHIQLPEYPLSIPKVRPSPFQREEVAFGYLASTAKYKILHIRFLNQYDSHCAVLTLGSHERKCCWKETNVPPLGSYHFGAVAFHGAVYLVQIDKVVARFDLEREEWTSIEGPKLVNQCASSSLMELAGSLCLNEYSMHLGTTTIWSLEDYNKGIWAWKYNIDVTSVFPVGLHVAATPLLIEKDGRVLVHIRQTKTLYYYEPRSKS